MSHDNNSRQKLQEIADTVGEPLKVELNMGCGLKWIATIGEGPASSSHFGHTEEEAIDGLYEFIKGFYIITSK